MSKNEIQSRGNFVAGYDYSIIITYLVLCILGLFFMLNINTYRSSLDFFWKHSIWLILGMGFLFISTKINLIKLRKYNSLFILVSILLLVLVLSKGHAVKGATRSLKFGPLNIQPSVLARMSLIFYFAHILDKQKKFISQSTPTGFIKYFKPLLLIPALVFLLILKERHLSTLIISGATLISMLWVSKVKILTIFLLVMIAGALGLFVLKNGEEYRGERIKIFQKYSLFNKMLNKNVDVGPVNDYQIKESLTALSYGKIIGTGVNKGRAKQYFLPEAKTDYIFAIIGEELGFIGALLTFGIYIFLFFRAMILANRNKDLYLRLLGIGLTLNLFINVLVNIGVAISALPSTGVTLPFISYGGTSLIINSIALGLILNITAKRKEVW